MEAEDQSGRTTWLRSTTSDGAICLPKSPVEVSERSVLCFKETLYEDCNKSLFTAWLITMFVHNHISLVIDTLKNVFVQLKVLLVMYKITDSSPYQPKSNSFSFPRDEGI